MGHIFMGSIFVHGLTGLDMVSNSFPPDAPPGTFGPRQAAECTEAAASPPSERTCLVVPSRARPGPLGWGLDSTRRLDGVSHTVPPTQWCVVGGFPDSDPRHDTPGVTRSTVKRETPCVTGWKRRCAVENSVWRLKSQLTQGVVVPTA